MPNMTIKEIDEALRDAMDNLDVDENGELIGLDDVEELQMAFDKKVEGFALYIKEQSLLAEAIKEEEKNYKARRESAEKRVERLKDYLDSFLVANDVDKFETAKCKISHRKSSSVFVEDETMIPEAYIRVIPEKREVNKQELSRALKDGHNISGAYLVEKKSLQIK